MSESTLDKGPLIDLEESADMRAFWIVLGSCVAAVILVAIVFGVSPLGHWTAAG